jgi:exodeoxyribonuclease-1
MTFYFFDLETSGFNPANDRIMQFAGQRTDMDLKPIGKPDNILIKITPDVLPQPDAVLVHGITPQKTISEGISEAEFAKYLTNQVCTPNTTMVGYNNVRFDNNFIRFILWRNFYDAYEWSWKEGCSTWDLLDVVRMTRALRPEGIKWPFAPDGKPRNKLEFLSSINGLDHADAHDALSDVQACLALAKLLKSKQPKLFDYLLKHRAKNRVAPLITSGRPVVYTSGRYPGEYHKTAVAVIVAEKDDKSGALMYDLRLDPDEFTNLNQAELAERWAARGEDAPYFPVKSLGYNRCPAIAPIEVLAKDNGYERLGLHKEIVENHLAKLKQAGGFADKLRQALEIMWPKQQDLVADPFKADGRLYDGFIPNEDRTKMSMLRAASTEELVNIKFKDERLNHLLPLFKRLEELAKTPGANGQQKYLLDELNLYAQSVIPIE